MINASCIDPIRGDRHSVPPHLSIRAALDVFFRGCISYITVLHKLLQDKIMVTVQPDQFSNIIHLWFHKQLMEKMLPRLSLPFQKCLLNAQLQNQWKCFSNKVSCLAMSRSSSVGQQQNKQLAKEDLLSTFYTFAQQISAIFS